MGIFSNNNNNFPWNYLVEKKDFIELWNSDSTFLVFKHSTRCSISSMALRNFENEFTKFNYCKLYLLDLIKYREISNQIAEETHVVHQSPQVLLVKNKKILYNASHENISANEIEKLL